MAASLMRAIWLFLLGASLSLAARPMWGGDALARENAPVVPDEMIPIPALVLDEKKRTRERTIFSESRSAG